MKYSREDETQMCDPDLYARTVALTKIVEKSGRKRKPCTTLQEVTITDQDTAGKKERYVSDNADRSYKDILTYNFAT